MRISRRCELCVLLTLLAASLAALAMVLTYSIWPSLPHEERVELTLVTNARIIRFDTPTAINTKTHKYTERNKGITAPCWLSIDFHLLLPDPSRPGGVKQLTSLVDLPYGLPLHGQPALNHSAACIRARTFAQSLREPVVLYLDVEDQNNAFFNVTTGASTPDYSASYDAHATPPGLVVMRTVGDGIGVGGGFLLTVCCVFIVLSSGVLGLRAWDDIKWARRATLGGTAGGAGSAAKRRVSHFARLGADEDNNGAGGDPNSSSDYQLATSPSRNHSQNRPSQSRSSRVTFAHSDIELEEQRLRRERGEDDSAASTLADHIDEDEQQERLEHKYDDEYDDEDALELEAPSQSATNHAAFEPRSPVPRLQPPPPTTSAAAAAINTSTAAANSTDAADIDIELASFEEEMLRHQHEIAQAQATPES